MKEYTFLALFSVLIVFALEAWLKTGLFKKKLYWFFLFLVFLFKLLVNGYLTGKSIVIYNPEFFLGFRLGSIPLEDFFFGFSMVTMTIIFWESLLKEAN